VCGICGIFYPTCRDRQPDADKLIKMRDRLTMRGPDASGLSLGKGYGLAHRRLSIIDLSAAGNQPMKTADGTVEIVCNGEIYNFRQLRAELEGLGYVFSSRTDTEVLLYGYVEWGLAGLLGRVLGMFAFAILDHRQWVLHLVRDPLGQKPLFYQWVGDAFVFASLACVFEEFTSHTINVRAVDNLMFSFAIGGEHTIFENVQRVLPGSSLTILSDRRMQQETYWFPDFSQPDHGLSMSEWTTRVEDVLKSAVERCLVSDVPLGITLSGGIDSSLITSMASEMVGQVSTFSVATADPAHDESVYARVVAAHCKTDHHELQVSGQNVRHLLMRLIAGMGEPFADASAINLIAISELLREHITVALTGDGGDEGFGGYSYFLAYHLADTIRGYVPSGARPALAGLARLLLRTSGQLHRLGTVLRLAALPQRETIAQAWFDVVNRRQFYTGELLDCLADYDPRQYYIDTFDRIKKVSLADGAMWTHILTILPDDYLVKGDYATMALGLEARSPFLERDVIDLATRIPAAVRFQGYKRKSILRQVASSRLPRDIVDRPKKGFVTPIWLWLTTSWDDLVQEFILGPHLEQRGWFRRDALEAIVRQHRHMPATSSGYFLWTLLVLELWLRLNIEHTLSAHDLI